MTTLPLLPSANSPLQIKQYFSQTTAKEQLSKVQYKYCYCYYCVLLLRLCGANQLDLKIRFYNTEGLNLCFNWFDH